MKTKFTYKSILAGSLFVLAAFNSQAQELSGLVAKYSFNNGNANDEVGTVHGTVNGATLTTDRFGNVNKAYSFNSLDSAQIIIPNAPSNTYANSDQFTIAYWVKFDASNETNVPIIAKALINGSWNGYSFYSNNTDGGYCNGQGKLFFYTAAGGMQDACADNLPSDNFNDWQFIVGVYGGTTNATTLYIDGVAQADLGSISGTLETNSDLFLGGFNPNPYTHYLTGSIDDLRIFNRTLSQQEITQLYNEANPTLGLNSLKKNTIEIVPNPANDFITISAEMETQIVIASILGEQISSLSINEKTTLDISKYPAGIYLISNLAGETFRFVKQ